MKQSISGVDISMDERFDNGIYAVVRRGFGKEVGEFTYRYYWSKGDGKLFLQRATTLQGLLLKRSLNEQSKT